MEDFDKKVKDALEYAKSNDFVKAEKMFNLLLDQYPSQPHVRYYRGCARLRLEKFLLAVEDYEAAISSQELSLELQLLALYKCGFSYQKLERFELALDNFISLTKLAKENNKTDFIHKGNFSMGTVYAQLNQHEAAIHCFTEAIEHSSGSIEDQTKVYYLHRGRSYAVCTEFGKAIKDLRIAIDESNDPLIKGCAHNELAQHDMAIKQFTLVIEPKQEKNKGTTVSTQLVEEYARYRRGLSYASLNDHERALEDYAHTATTSSNASRVLFRQGLSKFSLGNTQDALVSLNKSILSNNRQSDVYYARGMLRHSLGQNDAAVSDHRNAINYDRSSSQNNIVFYYVKQLLTAEGKLTSSEKDGSNLYELHRQIAEYKQRFASYAPDSQRTHRSAQENIGKMFSLSGRDHTSDSLILGIHKFVDAAIMSESVLNGMGSTDSEDRIVDLTMSGLLEVSQTLMEKAMKGKLGEVLKALNELRDISVADLNNNFNLIRFNFVIFQLKKVQLMERTGKKFKTSPHQHEFYTKLMIRLCNLLDALSVASTGFFAHNLKGIFTKVSYAMKALGYLSKCLPAFSEAANTVFGVCETGAKRLDEVRIQNALQRIGTLDTKENLYEAANQTAEKLTTMYERQIQRFSTERLDSTPTPKSSDQSSSCIRKCGQSCCGCIKKCKSRALNEHVKSNMESIAECAFNLIVNGIVDMNVRKMQTIDDLKNYFIYCVCDSPYLLKFYKQMSSDTITSTDATDNKDNWNTFDFFRKPGIRFTDDDIWCTGNENIKKYGHREPSWEEFKWHKTPKELEKHNFKKVDNIQLK